MKKYERIMVLKDATMKIVAEKTMVGLSMRKVSKCSGVNESMIYRDFESKEKLLRACYDSINGELAESLREMIEKKKRTNGDFLVLAEELWHEFADLLIENDYKTLYFCEYRDRYKLFLKMDDAIISEKRVNEEAAIYDAGSEKYSSSKMKEYAFQFFVESVTGYAKKVIRKEMFDSPENRRMTWEFLCRGIAC